MINLKKQKIFSATTRLILLTLFTGILFSCRKECDECNCTLPPEEPKPKYQEYFIAHAGGAIDGINYTNCREALDLSYSKGCRLFELDLRLTTDGKIVASHGEVEITEAEFMSQLIEEKYTPMNMDTLNFWFKNHQDAILITNKINDPERIYNEFQFRNRVIMELFSWKAVDKAIALGIKPMVSENLIFGSSKKAIEMGILPLPRPKDADIEQILKEKHIEYICMSRYYCIAGNEELLKHLKEKGIKNYVYHLEWGTHGEPAELYVWNYEMDYCYGMYANDLNLLEALLKRKESKSKIF